ncbi:MAG: hypothetical protein DCF20_03815 [Pseudanabaena sp.]|nr:MAG: hypothetical protein DCF20_03815 [Pseudanabaena sp.]
MRPFVFYTIKRDFGETEVLLSNLQQKIIREKPALKKHLEVSCLIILFEMTLIAAAKYLCKINYPNPTRLINHKIE